MQAHSQPRTEMWAYQRLTRGRLTLSIEATSRRLLHAFVPRQQTFRRHQQL